MCTALLRQIVGGSYKESNIALCEFVVDVLYKQRAWVLKHPDLVPAVVYVCLRLAADHYGARASASPISARITELMTREATLAALLLRDQYASCRILGRELLRALADTARIPIISALWQDMLTTPQAFGPLFKVYTLPWCKSGMERERGTRESDSLTMAFPNLSLEGHRRSSAAALLQAPDSHAANPRNGGAPAFHNEQRAMLLSL